MSERSQLYVRINSTTTRGDNSVALVARDNGWNYAERMISRCRHTIEWLKGRLEESLYIDVAKLNRILDVNFDMKDIVISSDLIEEHKKEGYSRDFEEDVFWNPGNHHGKLFIDVLPDGKLKYAFVDDDCHIERPMTAKEYMDWDSKDWKESEDFTEADRKVIWENLNFISKNATLMTTQELQEFIEYDYVSEMTKNKSPYKRKVLIEGFHFGEWVLLCTDAPRDVIGSWCDAAVHGGMPFNLFVDGLTGGKDSVRIISSSVYNDDRNDIWSIGTDECYELDDYVQERGDERE